MFVGDLILQTKLEPPQIKKKILRRERLLNLLKDNLDKKLILICADAGYGKTTLIAQLLSEIKDNFIYYNLSQADADPNNFFNHLIFGFKKYHPQFGEGVKKILSESPNFNLNVQRILTNFINETLSLKNHIIVLDDFHTLKMANWVRSAFEYLLTYLSSNTHFIISTREVPEFNQSRLLAKQELLMITKEELKFTNEEINQLLSEILSIKIGDTQLKRLIDISQGWITGIQLILPAQPDDEKIKRALNGFLASNLSLFEYFATEIFAHENKSIKKFLTLISIFDEIDPVVCNEIMNITNSHKILKEIEQRNIFVFSVGAQKTLYQYHPLFRNFLLEHLKTQPTEVSISSLYKRAAYYFNKTKQFDEAIKYYLRGQRYAPAIKLIEAHAEKIITKGRTASLQYWLTQIPQEFFNKSPWLGYWQAFLLDRIDCQLDEALNTYRRTERIFKKQAMRQGIAKTLLESSTILCRKGLIAEASREIRSAEKACPISDVRLRILIYNTKGMIADFLGEYQKVQKYLLKMLSLAQRLNEPSFLILTHCNLGVFYTEKGDFPIAEQEYEAAMKKIPKEDYYRRGIGLLYANAAFTKIHRGKLKEAQSLLNKGMDISVRYSDTPSLITVLNIFGDLSLAQNDLIKALEYYRQALAIVIEKGEERSRSSILESIVHLFIKKNDLVSAREYFELLTQRSVKKKDINLHPNWAILEAEIKIAEGNSRSALKWLKILLPIIQKKQLHFLIFKTNLYLALLNEELGKKIYLKYFADALKEAIAYNHAPIFQQDSRFLLLLRKVAGKKPVDDYIKRILSQTGQEPFPRPKEKLLKVRANFFGIPEVFSNGNLIASKNWVSEKAKKLFCYFIINSRKKITKDELIDTFWPDRTLADATNNLSSTIYYIRKAIVSSSHERYTKEIVLYRDRSYFLDPDLKIETDLKEFEQLVDEIKIRKSMSKNLDGFLTKAISIYRDQFAIGWYEPWVENQRTIYENIYLKLLAWASEDAFAQRDFETCLNYCQKLISTDQYDEEGYYLLIKSLLNLGRKGEALKYYKQLNEVLLEIKTSPSAKTQVLTAELFK